MPSLFSRDAAEWREQPLQAALETLSDLLSADDRSFLDRARGGLIKARRRDRLLCYPGWRLVELTFDPEALAAALDLEQTPAAARAYALASEDRAFFLNGRSSVLHAFNAGLEDGPKGSALHLGSIAAASEYLELFCHAVAGEEGPFFVLHEVGDIPWRLPQEEDHDFNRLVEKKRIEHGWQPAPISVPNELTARYLRDPEHRREFDAASKAPVQKEADDQGRTRLPEDVRGRIAPPEEASVETARAAATGDAGEDSGPSNFQKAILAALRERSDAAAAVLVATILYKNALFRSLFKVYRNGMVEMLEDSPLETELHARRRHYDPYFPVMLTQSERKRILPRDFVKLFLQSASQPEEAKNRPVSNLLVDGDVDLSGLRITRCRAVKDVIILGDLKLEDVRSEVSLVLQELKLTGRLLARNLRCDGVVDLRRLQTHGMHVRRGLTSQVRLEDRAVLSLSGARIAARLDLSEALSNGGVDLSEIDVKGRGLFHGLEVRIREPLERAGDGHARREDLVSVSLRNATFGGSVAFTEETVGIAWLMRSVKPRIHGTLDLHGAQIDGFLMLDDLEIKARYWATDPSNLDEQQARQHADLVEQNVLAGVINPKTGRLTLVEPRGQGGDLDMSSLRVRDGVRGELLHIAGDLNGEGLVSEKMPLVLRGARIGRVSEQKGEAWPDGSLILERATIGGLDLSPAREGIEGWRYTQILGRVDLTECRCAGSIRFWGAKMVGALEASGLDCAGSVEGDGFNRTQEETIIRGGVDLSSAKIGGSAAFRRCEIGAGEEPAYFDIQHAQIGESVYLCGASVIGVVNCTSALVGANFDASSTVYGRTRIDGDVILSGATISADLKLESVDIFGVLTMITGVFSRIFLRPTPQRVPSTKPEDPPSFVYEPSKIGGLLLHGAKLDVLNAAFLQSDARSADPLSGSIDIQNCEIANDILFHQDRIDRPAVHGAGAHQSAIAASLPDPAQVKAEIPKQLVFRRVRAGGDLVLTNARVKGAVKISGCEFGGLKASARLPELEQSEFAGASYSIAEPLKFTAQSVTLENVAVQADADLSGAVIEQDLRAPGLRVGGGLSFVHIRKTEDGAEMHGVASIGGKLELRQLRADSLSLSGDSFSAQAAHAPQRIAKPGLRLEPYEGYFRRSRQGALILERSEIGKFSPYGPPPRLADLQDLSIDLIECAAEHEEPRHTERRAEHMLHLSHPFNRQFYGMMETVYRNAGRDNLADKIYTEMRWRSVAPGSPPRSRLWLQSLYCLFCRPIGAFLSVFVFLIPVFLAFPRLGRRAWETLLGFFTSFWTRPGRILFYAMAVTTPLSLAVYALPENIAPSTEHLGEERADPELLRSGAPVAADWGPVEVARIWLNTHVPIAPIVSGRRWQPAENRPLRFLYPAALEPIAAPLTSPQCRNRPEMTDAAAAQRAAERAAPAGRFLGVDLRRGCNEYASPAGYGLIVSLLHWLAWPLFLIGASGFIRRRG